MAMTVKPNEATIIKKTMLPSFLSELNSNRATKEFWDECSTSKRIFSSSDIDKMKKICNSENDK